MTENHTNKHHFGRHGRLGKGFAACALGCAMFAGAGALVVHNAPDAFLEAAAWRGVSVAISPIVALGATERGKDSALVLAAYNGKTDAAVKLLKVGAHIHENGDEPLFSAVAGGHADTVRALLDRRADANAMDGSLLVSAAGAGSDDIVKALLDKGADIHALGDGAMLAAERGGHRETVVLLGERTVGRSPVQARLSP